MVDNALATSKLSDFKGINGLRLSSNDIPPRARQAWLREVICREYASVDIISPTKSTLSQNIVIYPWDNLQLSVIQSSAITLERLPQESYVNSQDAYFAVILVSGHYQITQNGRDVYLQPGDMTVYDATKPHRIHCPNDFTKLIISVPRSRFRDCMAGIDGCTALRIPSAVGSGMVASSFLRSVVSQADQLTAHEFSTLSDHALDLLTLAVASVCPVNYNLARPRTLAINRIKTFIEQKLADSTLNSTQIARGIGLSSRYINALFEEEGTSLKHYVWKRRLENCHKDMLNPIQAGNRISDIAFRWGFNDLSHFSRAFRRQFGCSPRELRHIKVPHHIDIS